MSMGREIKDGTPLLYNVIFDKQPDECLSYSCKDGKCLCMSNEQAGLLRKLLSEEDQMIMYFEEGRAVFFNIKSRPELRCSCRQLPTAGNLNADSLIFRKNILPDPELKNILCKMGKYGSDLEDILKSVPVIYMINRSKKMKDRDSLIYLCICSSCPERYLYILFRLAICRTIMCWKKAVNQREKEDFAKELAKLFERLNNLLEKRNEERRILIDNIIEYMAAWQRMSINKKIPAARNAFHLLEEYRYKLVNNHGDFISVYEEQRCVKLYALLKKILEVTNVHTESFPVLKFAYYESDETEYDSIISVLDASMNDKNKLSQIMQIIYEVFWNDVDVPSEFIDNMWEIAGK